MGIRLVGLGVVIVESESVCSCGFWRDWMGLGEEVQAIIRACTRFTGRFSPLSRRNGDNGAE